jgi:hypothetical protein
MQYNIAPVYEDGSMGNTCLLAWVDLETAKEWQYTYWKKYVGKAYPNGKGFYPQKAYVVIDRNRKAIFSKSGD